MAYRVEILPAAASDAEEAFVWWRGRAPDAADAWVLGLLDAIFSLEELPHRCPVVPESEAVGVEIRQLLYGKAPNVYRIYFRVVGEDTVRVLRIRHGARRHLPSQEIVDPPDNE